MDTVNNDVQKRMVGRAERVSFVDAVIKMVPARIDTGAKTSAVWASNITEQRDGLHFTLFSKKSKHYTGQEIVTKQFETRIVASSIGAPQERYAVKLKVKLKTKVVLGTFTLADRSQQAYPVLIGRNILRGKFIVDVKEGRPARALEKKRTAKLQAALKQGRGA